MATKVKTRIYRGTPRNLNMLARNLLAGEVVGVPTETVYGLAANALDAAACKKIFHAKGRPTTDPLIVHLPHGNLLETVAKPNAAALALAAAFWPGPLTLILPKQAWIPDIVTANFDSVAVRVPRHPLFRKLLRIVGKPLAAPSANPFGYVSPTTAEHVRSGLGGRIECILDGGPASVGLESTIVDVRDPKHIKILRPGEITVEQISKTLGHSVQSKKHQTVGGNQLAPGMLSRHYSPRARVLLSAKLASPQHTAASDKEAWLFFAKPRGTIPPHCYWLAHDGNQRRAAQQLFFILRKLDGQRYRTVHTELAPDGPYAVAINDRLRRAAAQA